jgi:hypothetical protein
MTLNEKFDKATDGWIVADKCEEIAEEFAIDFAEWLLKNYDGIKSVKELLEIYKKEKGL